MQYVQTRTSNFHVCAHCGGSGVEPDFYSPNFEEMMSSIWECRPCNGSGLILQKNPGGVCPSSAQSSGVVGQGATI